MIFDIKTYRLTYHCTQQQMADALGLQKSAISMIERGQRELPEHARRKLREMQSQNNDAAQPAPVIRAEPFYKKLKAEHQQQSDEYIRSYIGDLQSEKHKLEKKLAAWTKKFNDAGIELKKTEHELSVIEKNNIHYTDNLLRQMMGRRIGAEDQLREVIRQKPELAMIRIEGINRELTAAKQMLGKRQRFPVLDAATAMFKGVDVKKIEPGGEW